MEISDLATVSSWGVISRPSSSHVLDDHLGDLTDPTTEPRGSELRGQRQPQKKKSQEICRRGEEEEGSGGWVGRGHRSCLLLFGIKCGASAI